MLNTASKFSKGVKAAQIAIVFFLIFHYQPNISQAATQGCCILGGVCYVAEGRISTSSSCDDNGGVWVEDCNKVPECELGCCILNNVNGTECLSQRTKTGCQDIEGSIWDPACSNSLCQGESGTDNCCILESGGCQPVNSESECQSPNSFQTGNCSTNNLCRVGCCVNQKTIGECEVLPQGECVVKGGGLSSEDPTWKWYDNSCDQLAECTFYSSTKNDSSPVEFVPSVTIPEQIQFGGKTFSVNKGQGIKVDGWLLAKYIALLFKWLLGAVGVVAVAFVAYGGILWLTAFGNAEAINKARKTIFDALVGVVLVLTSFVLLNQVNEKLVVFKSLDVKPVPPKPLEQEEDIASQPPPNLVDVQGDNIVAAAGQQIDRNIMIDLIQVAKVLKKEGYSLIFSSGYRTPQKQKKLIINNCQNPNDDKPCVPKPGRPLTCKMLNGPNSCPHTSGRAVDIWGGKGQVQCITQDQCNDDINACRQNECQSILIQEMKKLGYCVLSGEPWHFEKPKMSSSCQ